MIGAILGDIAGSPYEFDRGRKVKDFGPLFIGESGFTDDSVMTIAIAEALLSVSGEADDEIVKRAVIKKMQEWGKRYPHAGYGQRFYLWLSKKDPKPYDSWGNGSAMRVSSVGWLYDSLEETRRFARLIAEVTHNHPEGIKGAEATASAIYMARTGASKEDIKDYIIREFAYDLSRTCNEIRPGYHHVESCQETVPEAITAFLEGKDFEDVIRTAVSLGGDCDTLTCIAGSIAEAFYGVPDEMKEECRKRLPADMLRILDLFEERTSGIFEPPILKKAIRLYKTEPSDEHLSILVNILRKSLVWVPCNAVFSDADNETVNKAIMEAEKKGDLESLVGRTFVSQDEVRMVPDILGNGDDLFFPVFSSDDEMGEYRKEFSKVQMYFQEAAGLALNNENNVRGIVINAFSDPFEIPREMIGLVTGITSGDGEEDGDDE